MGSGLRSKNYLIGATLLRDQVPSFDEYPFNIPAIRHLSELEFDQPVTFLVGENGSGKSTLLEAIAVRWGLNPEGGSRNFAFSTRASHSNLYEYLRLARGVHRAGDGFFLRAESYFNLATKIDELDSVPSFGPPIIDSYGKKSLHAQSHGESFIALVKHRLNGSGFYVLDEPEAALSPSRQLSLMTLMHELVADGAQFLIATHSPILMAYPLSTIFLMGSDGPRAVSYRSTEHYAITKRFLNDPEGMLAKLFGPEEE
jgi:predicted ATPase